jgi:hypothetical protein
MALVALAPEDFKLQFIAWDGILKKHHPKPPENLA